jgi:YesN/AraC family two-component response regulator
MIEETLPDILITDFLMPHMDGSQLSRKLKTVKPEAKVIMLSGFNEMQIADLDAAAETIVDFRLLKPIDFELLFAAVEKCLAASLAS